MVETCRILTSWYHHFRWVSLLENGTR